MKVRVEMKPSSQIVNRILDDDVGRFLAETWAKIFEKYTPRDSGTLGQSYITEPWKVTYTQRYSHYQWQGVSKKGKPLNYNKEKNMLAQSHWEEAATVVAPVVMGRTPQKRKSLIWQ